MALIFKLIDVVLKFQTNISQVSQTELTLSGAWPLVLC